MEFIKVLPGKFGPTLSYLDDNWMPIREEAKRPGTVLSYHLIAEKAPQKATRTEYENQSAYGARGELFASIFEQVPHNSSGVLLLYQRKDLYETVSTQVFQDYQDTHIAQFRLLAKD
jgi:hypothetical protein